MELRVISRDENEIELEIGGEDHTFMSVLKESLLDTDGVIAATYDMNPEQSGGQVDPILTVKTETDVDPLDAIARAAGEIQERVDAFRSSFAAAT